MSVEAFDGIDKVLTARQRLGHCCSKGVVIEGQWATKVSQIYWYLLHDALVVPVVGWKGAELDVVKTYIGAV